VPLGVPVEGEPRHHASVLEDPWDAWGELNDRPLAGLVPTERLLYALGWLRTELNNGGFDQYFFNSSGDLAETAIEAVRAADVPELASLVITACSLLGHPYPAAREARQERLEELADDLEDEFEALDARYFAIESTQDLSAAMSRLASA
jgi:hypothetical protein